MEEGQCLFSSWESCSGIWPHDNNHLILELTFILISDQRSACGNNTSEKWNKRLECVLNAPNRCVVWDTLSELKTKIKFGRTICPTKEEEWQREEEGRRRGRDRKLGFCLQSANSSETIDLWDTTTEALKGVVHTHLFAQRMNSLFSFN